MQIVSFRPAGSDGSHRAGFSDGTSIVASTDIGYPESVKDLLNENPDLTAALDKARAALAAGEGLVDAASVHLGPAVPDPDKILCIGLNYHAHAAEADKEVEEFPPLFAKFKNSLVGPTDDIVMPGVSTEVDYEVELAVVIGARCKNVSVAEALDYVAGYSVFNDISARDLQVRSSQWTTGKMLDTFGPLGPGVTPRQEIEDVQSLRIRTRVNGTTLQDSNTADMIWPVAEMVSYLSEILTLEPGDVIATGTPEGVGLVRKPPIWLKAGDVVETEIETLGLLRNPVVEAAAR